MLVYTANISEIPQKLINNKIHWLPQGGKFVSQENKRETFHHLSLCIFLIKKFLNVYLFFFNEENKMAVVT